MGKMLRTMGAAALFLLSAGSLAAQGSGRLVGRVVTQDSGIPIADVRVSIVGTSLVAVTNIEGRFTLANVPPGDVAVRAVAIGFTPKVVTEVRVVADSLTRQDVTLDASVFELQEIVVRAAEERGSVNAALDMQRTAVSIVSAISSEQMARSPDGDAGTALQRVSGATVQDGTPSVRGLGDRFTTVVLNGARMGSSDPERKSIDLSQIPTSLLEYVSVSKSATADQEGDFAGATIRMQTRGAVEQPFLSLTFSTGYNDAVTGRQLLRGPRAGGDVVAFGAATRRIPSALAGTDLTQPITPTQTNALVNGLRNLWSPGQGQAAPNASLGLSLGGTTSAGLGGISYVLAGNWSRSEEVQQDQRRALAEPTTDGLAEFDRYTGTTGRQGVLWGGIANLTRDLGANTRLSFHNTYTRGADNEARHERGTSENLGGMALDVTRLRYVERSVLSDRLALQHRIGLRHTFDASVTHGRVRRQEPDRSEMVYVQEHAAAPFTWLGFSNEAAVRTFGDLRERSTEVAASWLGRLGADQQIGTTIQAGILLRSTRREADNRSYSISLNRPLPTEVPVESPEAIFDGRFSGEGDTWFRIVPLFAGGAYQAQDRLSAGYVQTTMPLMDAAIELTAGLRAERSQVRVDSRSTANEASEARHVFTDLLPSASLTWRVRPRTNLRLSATQTLARPEYRELSPILAREVIGGDNIKGNPDLRRTLIRNFDLRWEFYPATGELLSVALFAKHFTDPIEKVYLATSGTRIITHQNARGASDYGVELEARKALAIDGWLSAFTMGGNLTLMRSRVQIDTTITSLTSVERRMVGQSPYLLNASLTWTSPSGRSTATVLFNRSGERVSEAGERPLPDVIEAGRSLLDVAVRFPLTQQLGVKVNGQNLLDAPIRLTQGSITREYARSGRVVTLGFSWMR